MQEKKGNKKLYEHLCPICGEKILAPNEWVRYHISYDPPMVILACSYCNFTEYVLRQMKGAKLKYPNAFVDGQETPVTFTEVFSKRRVELVQQYQRFFGKYSSR